MRQNKERVSDFDDWDKVGFGGMCNRFVELANTLQPNGEKKISRGKIEETYRQLNDLVRVLGKHDCFSYLIPGEENAFKVSVHNLKDPKASGDFVSPDFPLIKHYGPSDCGGNPVIENPLKEEGGGDPRIRCDKCGVMTGHSSGKNVPIDNWITISCGISIQKTWDNDVQFD
jgi:hypothetical protein